MFVAEVVSAAADVYGTGVLLYELLAGRTPFAGGAGGTGYAIAQPPRHAACPRRWTGCRRRCGAPSARCSHKDPRSRPTATAAAAVLRELLPQLQGVAALPPALGARSSGSPSRAGAPGGAPALGVLGRRPADDLDLDPGRTTVRAAEAAGPTGRAAGARPDRPSGSAPRHPRRAGPERPDARSAPRCRRARSRPDADLPELPSPGPTGAWARDRRVWAGAAAVTVLAGVGLAVLLTGQDAGRRRSAGPGRRRRPPRCRRCCRPSGWRRGSARSGRPATTPSARRADHHDHVDRGVERRGRPAVRGRAPSRGTALPPAGLGRAGARRHRHRPDRVRLRPPRRGRPARPPRQHQRLATCCPSGRTAPSPSRRCATGSRTPAPRPRTRSRASRRRTPTRRSGWPTSTCRSRGSVKVGDTVEVRVAPVWVGADGPDNVDVLFTSTAPRPDPAAPGARRQHRRQQQHVQRRDRRDRRRPLRQHRPARLHRRRAARRAGGQQRPVRHHPEQRALSGEPS